MSGLAPVDHPDSPATGPGDPVPDYVAALEAAADYLTDGQRQQLRRAWAIGAAAHAGQTRRSGEPYITTLDEFKARIHRDFERYGGIVKAAGVQVR